MSALATSPLLGMTDACYDTGSAEGITTDRRDLLMVDESERAKGSVRIRGPSVGTPGCAGRGPMLLRLRKKVGDKETLGLVMPDGILAECGDGSAEFRIAPAQQMKKRGVRIVGGKFEESDTIECVRTGKTTVAITRDEILVVETEGHACDIEYTPCLKKLVRDVRNGLASPLIDLEPFLGRGDGGVDDTECLMVKMISSMILNEKKLTWDERARLWKRKFGNCASTTFKPMGKMWEYGDFPELPILNEDDVVMDLAKMNRRSFPKNDSSIMMNCPPWWRVWLDGYGGQGSMGGVSYEGAVGGYLFCCASTGSTDQRLYASHLQFPVALYQFLVRVEAEHFRVHVIFVDTHSVNLSAEVEEICALFKCTIQPVSAGTPQEMAFAESKVRMVKRMSTAMLLGAPHLPKECWALCDKYAVFCLDFLPQSTRGNHCPWYLRTGRRVNWDILPLYVMGAPLVYSPMEAAVHKRAAINEEGNFVGVQWPACLVRRLSDGKVLSVARQKVRVYESAYIEPLDTRCDIERATCDMRTTVEEIANHGHVNESAHADPQTVGHKPELDKNMVQSIKSLREHGFSIGGTTTRAPTEIEKSAQFGNVSQGGEGVYASDLQAHEIDGLLRQIEDATTAAKKAGVEQSIQQKVISKLRDAADSFNPAVNKGRLKIGKAAAKSGIDTRNIVDKKRKHDEAGVDNADEVAHMESSSSAGDVEVGSSGVDTPVIHDGSQMHEKKSKSKKKKGAKGGSARMIKEGDLVSCASTEFDGNEPGSWSDGKAARAYGIVTYISKEGRVMVHWHEDDSKYEVRMKALRREVAKATESRLVILLMEGATVAFESQDKKKWPKDFFEVLVKKDWRKWVEAVKKELSGWDDNGAVEVVDIRNVPTNAKVVPLGELYTIKRDGTYKYRQYLMGNLLREGVDFTDTFSTTVSGPGLCTFYSLATTCGKLVHGWDAVCGYLQVKEQFDIYAFLPTHQEYSSLEYEEIAQLRRKFLNLVSKEGEEGLKKFTRLHKREMRSKPKSVLKCCSSVYGSPGAGHEFEMLMHSVHTKTAKMTQTQPEPSMFVRIRTDPEDKVVGYVIVMAWTDDVRMFGTDRELEEYKAAVRSRLKVKFEEGPVAEFVSIETHQCLKTNTTELKMPKYWLKAAAAFQEFKGPTGWKERVVPLTPYDEKILLEVPTEEEILEAKHFPLPQLVGTMSYPASNCKFEMRLAVSMLGSRRSGWSKKQFEVCIRVLEYGIHTREIGLMYSKDLDPHGRNVLYAYADANHRTPRSQGCRIVMFNGACVCFTSKKHTITAPSTCWSEMITMFDCTIDVMGLRNLLAELGMYQEHPTRIYQDNQAAIQIANNRGSLGKTSRAMDLKTLSTRNHIEDHEVETAYINTTLQVGDMGTKGLPEDPFVRLRDTMNGYALVKAHHPDKEMSSLVYSGEVNWNGSGKSTKCLMVEMIQAIPWIPIDEI